MWTIYTFGDGDLIVQLLRAIALLVNGGLGSLIQAASLIGFAVLLAMSVGGSIEVRHVLSWFMAIVVLANLLISVRTQVAVEDVIDTRIPPQVVGDVPYLVALPASLASEASYRLTLLATSLQLNGEMGNGLSILRPTSNLQALLESELVPGDLRANLINYLHVCVVHPGSGLSHTELANRPDLFAAIASASVAVYLPVIQDGQENGSLTCSDFYTQILSPRLAPLLPQSDTGLTASVNQLSCKVVGGRQLVNNGSVAPCYNLQIPFWDELNQSIQALQFTAAVDAQTAFTTIVIAKLWRLAEIDVARGQYDTASAIAIANDGLIKQLEVQTKTGQLSNRNGLFRQIRALADGMVYLGGPILIVFSMTPLVWKALALYLRLFAWLAIWGPLQAVANFVVLGIAVSDLTGLAVAQNGVIGVTMANFQELYVRVVQSNALGYDVMIAVPAVALAVAWGGVGALGSMLAGSSGHIISIGREQLTRVESGQEVLASSLSRGSVMSTAIMRPHFPGLYALSSHESSNSVADWYQNSAVSRGLGGSTITSRQGEVVSMRHDGSSSVASPTRNLSVAPDGSLYGTMRADTTTIVPGLGNVQGGSIVEFTGNGAKVQEPSTRDPLTGIDITPTAYYARDRNDSDKLNLVSKQWSFSRGGLNYEAVQGIDGTVSYRATGRTDGSVLNPDGTSTPVTMTVDARVLTDSKGELLGSWQGDSSFLTGNMRQKGEGEFNMEAVGGPIFIPYVSQSSNQRQTDVTSSTEVAGVSATLTTRTVTGSNGSDATQFTASLKNGLNISGLIPQNLIPANDGVSSATVTIEGYLRGVSVRAGEISMVTDLQVPPGTSASITLPSNWSDLPIEEQSRVLGKAIGQAFASIRPFDTSVLDPDNPTRTLQLKINQLFPPSPSGAIGMYATGATGEVSTGSESVPGSKRWTAYASNAVSSSTVETLLNAPGIGGKLSVQGQTDIFNGVLTGRGVITLLDSNGARLLLGAGSVEAKRTPTGWPTEWEVVSAKLDNGVSLTQGGRVEINRTRTIAPGVVAHQTGMVDLSTGGAAWQHQTVGVTPDNVKAVQKAFGNPVFTPEPGGELILANRGSASYRGPATVVIQVPDGEGGMRAVSVPGIADLHGRYDSESGTVTMQTGSVRQAMETTGSTASLPPAARRVFEQFGQQGVVRVIADPSGKALRVHAEGGVESRMTDTRQVNVGTLDVNSASAFAMAMTERNDSVLAQLIYDPDKTARYNRAAQVIGSLSSFIGGFYTHTGLSQDSFATTGGLNVSVPGDGASRKKGSQFHEVKGSAGGSIGYRTLDTKESNLLAHQLWEGYEKAEQAASRGTTPEQQQRNFVSTLHDEWSRTIQDAMQYTQKHTPWAFGSSEPLMGTLEYLKERFNGDAQRDAHKEGPR